MTPAQSQKVNRHKIVQGQPGQPRLACQQVQPGGLVDRQARCLAPRGADDGPGPAVGDEISLGLEQLVGLAHGHYIDARVLRQCPGGGQPLAGGQLPLRHGQHHLIPDLAVDGHRALKIQPEQHFHSSCLYY